MFLRDYEYVTELARTGSILKAAQNLCISSSALSKYIRNIEDDLGMPLFQRGGKIFTLTYAGERYLSWAREILIQNQGMEKEMRSIRDQQSGRIRLGFPRISLHLVLEQILPKFRNLHPQISLILHEDTTAPLIQLLQKNELDIIMIPFHLDPEKFEHIVLTQDERALVVHRDHPLAWSGIKKPGFRYPWVDLRSFAQEEFVLCHPGHTSTELVQHTFDQYQISPPVAFRALGAESCLLAAAQGLGCTFTLSPHAIQEYGIDRKVVLLSFGESPLLFDRVLAYPRSLFLGEAEKDLIQLLRDSASGNGG